MQQHANTTTFIAGECLEQSSAYAKIPQFNRSIIRSWDDNEIIKLQTRYSVGVAS